MTQRKKGLNKQFQRETLHKKLSYRLVPLWFDASFDSDPGELCSILNVKRQVRVYMNKESPRREMKWTFISLLAMSPLSFSHSFIPLLFSRVDFFTQAPARTPEDSFPIVQNGNSSPEGWIIKHENGLYMPCVPISFRFAKSLAHTAVTSRPLGNDCTIL